MPLRITPIQLPLIPSSASPSNKLIKLSSRLNDLIPDRSCRFLLLNQGLWYLLCSSLRNTLHLALQVGTLLVDVLKDVQSFKDHFEMLLLLD